MIDAAQSAPEFEPEILPPAFGHLALTRIEAGGAAALRLPDLPADDPLYETVQAAHQYMEEAKAAATRRAYSSDWRHFAQWCDQNGLASLPATPSTVALYLTSLAKPADGEKPRKAATITRRLTSINAAHKEKGLDSPATMNHRLVADTLHGIRRRLGVAQTRKKPLTRDRIVKLLGSLVGPIAAARDKALLLIGFAGSLRRSELAALKVEEITWHRKGITLLIPRSKTDQEGEGREVEILLGVHDQTCPVMALENWLKISGVKAGQVFRRVGQHGNVGEGLDKDSIGRIVKRLVRRAKLANPESYGGHSLRAGFVTEASANGATDRQIMKQTGHKSIAMVHRYAREDQKDRQAAAGKLGL
ncbi:MAG TPA: site-specific integrase [Terracidiphilus sp.]|nr:site-specific integrase [Terracidiphilus sp.]